MNGWATRVPRVEWSQHIQGLSGRAERLELSGEVEAEVVEARLWEVGVGRFLNIMGSNHILH